MALRFRRSFKIAPGVRVNIGKNGLSSISVGTRGASMSFGKSGTYSNVGIPGTGLSFRNKVGGSSKREEQRLQRLLEKAEEEKQRMEALSKVTLNLDEETGTLEIFNSFGEPLSRKDMKTLWELKGDFIESWLEEESMKINGDVNLLENIYLDTPNPNNISLSYKAKEYPKEKPIKPNIPNEPKIELPSLGFFASLFKSKREAHKKEINALKELHSEKVKKWKQKKEAILNKYQSDLEKWKSEKERYEEKQKHYEENFDTLIFSDDTELMEILLEEVLENISWPRETLISYEIDDKGKTVWLDVDLPEIEDLPQKVSTIAANRKKLNIKNKSQKQLRMEYAKHIHGIAFRLVGLVFVTLPKTENIIISGYSQRLDTATGKVKDEYLYSYNINRNGFLEINFEDLEKVNPIHALDVFEHRKKMTTTGIFKPIEPFGK